MSQQQPKIYWSLFTALTVTLLSMTSLTDQASSPRESNRGPANAFGSLAPPSINIAGILQTFQNPNTLLPIAQTVSQIQSRMQGAIPAGTPYWDGTGQLPGAIGTPEFNPTFSFDSSGCSVVSMTFYDVYLPAQALPTIWCGAVSNQKQPARVSGGATSATIPASAQASTQSAI